MTKTLIAVVAALAVAGAGWYWYMGGEKPDVVADDTFGTYAYSCDNGVRFEMTLFSNVSSVALKAQGSAPFSEVVLEQKSSSTYATQEGEVVLVGDGEEIKLTVGAANMTCNPVPSDDMAPFNWGGAGEGPDASAN
ncbi:MAG: hypothetical protein JWL87_649 [Candidatus Adlerbacteria bacterium]|nr:hypothetical protein [Candidatus Adlerbacteria bacterium]